MPNSSFSTVLPTLQLGIDQTSLGYMEECLYKYKLTIIDGYAAPGESADLTFGLHYHATLEQYDHARADGKSHTDAMLFALRYMLHVTWDYELNRPWISNDPYKNRENLFHLIVDYLTFYENDTLQTYRLANGNAAVELSFRFEPGWTIELQVKAPELKEGQQIKGYWFGTGTVAWVRNIPDDSARIMLGVTLDTDGALHEIVHSSEELISVIEHYVLCGHFDRVATETTYNLNYIVDRKTTRGTINAAYFARYSPDVQMSHYDFSGSWVFGTTLPIAGIMIDAAQVKLEEPNEFKRDILTRSESQRTEWIKDTQYYINLAALAARRNHWPQNRRSCGNVKVDPITQELQYGCPFRKVCAQPPEMRQQILDVYYDRRVWDPLKTRERDAQNAHVT